MLKHNSKNKSYVISLHGFSIGSSSHQKNNKRKTNIIFLVFWSVLREFLENFLSCWLPTIDHGNSKFFLKNLNSTIFGEHLYVSSLKLFSKKSIFFNLSNPYCYKRTTELFSLHTLQLSTLSAFMSFEEKQDLNLDDCLYRPIPFALFSAITAPPVLLTS